MRKEWHINDESELNQVAKELLDFANSQKIFCLFGEMGAGKTTFVKALCKALGVVDMVSSPTFSIVNEYAMEDGSAVFHFDFYRIRNLEEAYDIGYENYFFSGEYCFIEWPEKIESLLNFPKADIFITSEMEKRIITCTYE
jgi:tRNA threonylcarbamoyladenosine biosynthesis protein TsaE